MSPPQIIKVHDKDAGESKAEATEAKTGSLGQSSNADAKNDSVAGEEPQSNGLDKDSDRESPLEPTVPSNDESLPLKDPAASVAEDTETQPSKDAERDTDKSTKPIVPKQKSHDEASRKGKEKVPVMPLEPTVPKQKGNDESLPLKVPAASVAEDTETQPSKDAERDTGRDKSTKPPKQKKSHDEASRKGKEKVPVMPLEPTVPKQKGNDESLPLKVPAASVAEGTETQPSKDAERDTGRDKSTKPIVPKKKSHDEASRKGKGKVPATEDNKPQPKTGPETKARVPSIFTEEQIKGRKQAWDRISMPLNPLKVGKPAGVASGGSEGSPSKSGASQHAADAEGPKTACEAETSRGHDVASPKSDSDSAGTITQESGSMGSPPRICNRVADILCRVFEQRYTLGEKRAKGWLVDDGAAPLDQSTVQCPGGESRSEASSSAPRLGAGDEKPSQASQMASQAVDAKDGPSQASQIASQAVDAKDGPSQASQIASQAVDAKDGPAMTGQPSGHDTLRGKNKKKSKKNRKVTSTPPVQADQQAPAQGDDEARGGRELPRPPHDQDARTAGLETGKATDQGKVASSGQNDNGQAGSNPRPAQHGPKNEYRADAGGSLRISKKRRNQPQALDTQIAESHGRSAGTPTFSSTPPFKPTSPDDPDVNIVRHGQQGAEAPAGLNPLAPAFESPGHSAAESKATHAGKGGGHRGGSTRGGGPGRQQAKAQDGWPVSAKEAPKDKKDVRADEWPSLLGPEASSSTFASVGKGKQRAVPDDAWGVPGNHGAQG
ncbi:hypothetical protein OCS_04014 [Ophiocordyceps sinensis CO18]|uniref:Uncharacterized protein n=1 Tax=Ophiocordyceps sinensis (strain Co18 / CGMCC 3.14243) TaxID=911162 RepID=T5ACG0_OPHSC|nr:hypothetical protein OCS_04014 [Ophiocordyceps sinensis CO18]